MQRAFRILIVLAAAGLLTAACQSLRERQMRADWQALNDTIAIYSQQIQNIVNTLQMSYGTTETTQRNLLHHIDSLDREMKAAIHRCAQRNKGNELGRYIEQNYSDQ